MAEKAEQPEGSPLYHEAQLSSIRNKTKQRERLLPVETRYLNAIAKHFAKEPETASRRSSGPTLQDFAKEAVVLRVILKKARDGAELSADEKQYLDTGDTSKLIDVGVSASIKPMRIKAGRPSSTEEVAEKKSPSEKHPAPKQVEESADKREEVSVLLEVDYDIPLNQLVQQFSFGKYIPPVFSDTSELDELKLEGKHAQRFVAIPTSGGELKDLDEMLQKRGLVHATVKELLTFVLNFKEGMPINFKMHAFGSRMPDSKFDDVWTPVLEQHDFSSTGGTIEIEPNMYDISSKQLSREKTYVLVVRRHKQNP